MKTLKKTVLFIIFSLAVLAGVEKDSFASFFHAHKQIDYTANEARTGNTVNALMDYADEVASVIPDIYLFNSNQIQSENILKSESFFPQNICTRIWQPPKLS